MKICGIRDRIAPKNAVILDFLKGCGGELISDTEFHTDPLKWDAVVTFSYTALDVIRTCQKCGIDFWMVDNPYVLNEGKISDHGWFRATKNRNQAKWKECPPDRWENLLADEVELQPWKKQPAKHTILFCEASSDLHEYTKGLSLKWEQERLAMLENNYRVIRRPRFGNKDSINEAMKKSSIMACYSSNAAVDAIIYGIPAITSAESITYLIGSDPKCRPELMHCIAYSQFTRQEMADGTAWEILNR